MNNRRALAQAQFLTWVKQNYPDMYYTVMSKALAESGGLMGLGETAPTESLWSKLTAGLTSLGTTYLTLRNQRDAMKLNLARAEQGLPPVDAGVTAPVIRTQIDLPPDVVSKLTAEAGSNVNKILLFGAAALAALFFWKKR